MDGNLSKEGMTKDLESMKQAGIGSVVFLEVNVGVPRGHIDFLSETWQDHFAYAVKEAERLGIEVILGSGPGWAGSGGPWVKPEQSMQHLVASRVTIKGDGRMQHLQLPKPQPKKPFFGEGALTPELREKWLNYYQDVAVLAFPSIPNRDSIADIEEKALYYRAPYSSAPGVKPRLTMPDSSVIPKQMAIQSKQIIDLSDKLQQDGSLDWEAPAGNWTIMRFGCRNNGAVTRPAPMPGLGFEVDKMDSAAFRAHLDHYVGALLKKIGVPKPEQQGGLKRLHIDSWEMGAQNWTANFRAAFKKRRGYDPQPYYPIYAGYAVGDGETSERFLWDLRLTAQELILANHAQYLKQYSHDNNLKLSIEPYDMNPNSDMDLGAIADVPMAEFWSKGYGFNTVFSVLEATSIAHIGGKQRVAAEAFTAQNNEAWKQYPEVMKNQGDWAFAMGINQFMYHTFQHQALADSLRPGMTMGPYGVHWDRNQTWWPLVEGYHRYIARCSYILQQGRTVADILYLTPEGAPQVFTPPASALSDDEGLPDKKGYNFDGCSPLQLMGARVKDHRVVFPSGATYAVLVLPNTTRMTPALADKIRTLVQDGATVVANPPHQSPSLVHYPNGDTELKAIVKEIWDGPMGKPVENKPVGKGEIVSGTSLYAKGELYPSYDVVQAILEKKGIVEDFSGSDALRYTHRTAADYDIYFVSNKTEHHVTTTITFRNKGSQPELWDPLNGQRRLLADVSEQEHQLTKIPLQFESYQSYFIVFPKQNSGMKGEKPSRNNVSLKTVQDVQGLWKLTFDSRLGGPKKTITSNLIDWSKSSNDSMKYYSGIVRYEQHFDVQEILPKQPVYLDLGQVKNMAKVYVNGKDLGTVWTAPWRVEVTDVLKQQDNVLKIEVANLWVNRLIGDQQYPDDGVKDGKWPQWLLDGKPRNSQRVTFTTFNPYNKNDTLRTSGLLGPVRIVTYEK
ncbi:hypothetical protein GCM10023231_30010 [Olivibacter ginsenosidimutans]|uniref:Beta-mannosidase-like galactose-binding domain-containing protein n=2 Tax=Olivibacter ginsenosidimutans TaxID=1176537 RepID=A0ABP9BUR4_9SPHI